MSDLPTDKKIIGYEEFRYICFFDEKGSKRINDFGGFRLERNGLFRMPLDQSAILLDGELDALAGDCGEPALAFPCTPDELRTFVAENGFLGCIDEGNLSEVIAAKAKSPQPFDQGVTLKKNEMVAKYQRIWRTIELDFKEAPDNKLLEEAAAIEYGYWVEHRCLSWARSRRKLDGENRPTAAAPANPFTGLGSLAIR